MSRLLTTLARYLHPRSAVAFWHTPIGRMHYSYPTLMGYYIDLRAKTLYAGPHDSDGIPLLNYFGAVGKQYNPCAVAQWGLGGFQRWQMGDVEARAIFFRAADWLLDRLVVDEGGRGYWWYQFDFDAYGLRAPWASALAQAQGISVLLRAHLVSGNTRYRDAATRAVAAMLAPVADGGLLLKQGGCTFLEEVVADRPTAILDGLIFALFGLQDYCYVFVGDGEAAQVLHEGLDTIERLLPSYDLGYWSRADLYSDVPPMPASTFYHTLHVAQLQVLADLSGRASFQDYAQRWENYARSPVNRCRAFANKLAFKFLHY